MDKKIDPFAIREGGTYRLRGGGVVGPIRLAIKPGDLTVAHYAFDVREGGTYYWDTNGIYCASMLGKAHHLDLVEMIEPPLFPGTNDRIPQTISDRPDLPKDEIDPVDLVFPQHARLGETECTAGGMTLRQYYAGQFLAAIVNKTSADDLFHSLDQARVIADRRAKGALLYADALIAAEKESR